MTCQEFEKIVADLARERMMEVSARETGLAHVAECERCALRLNDERSLRAGLRALAATTESAQAPARMEASLLAAFREQKQSVVSGQWSVDKASVVSSQWSVASESTVASQNNTPVEKQNVVAFSPQSASVLPLALRNPQLKWWLAIAAGVLLLALIAPGLLNSSEEKKDSPIVYQTPTPQILPEPQPSQLVVPQQVNVPNERRNDVQPFASHNDRNVVAISSPGRSQRNKPQRLAGGYEDRRAPMIEAVDPDRVYSDFIPLNGGWASRPLDSGQVMRVRMPRSALPAFGLPVNADRLNESIEAEVLVGEDSIPHAIRFANYVPRRRVR